MISFDFHHLGAFFRPGLSRFPPCSLSFESAIVDSKLAQRFQVCYAQKLMHARNMSPILKICEAGVFSMAMALSHNDMTYCKGILSSQNYLVFFLFS